MILSTLINFYFPTNYRFSHDFRRELRLINSLNFAKRYTRAIKKAMINDHQRVSKVSWKFCILAIYNFQTFTNCVHVKCKETALRVHEYLCTVLIPLYKNNLNLSISYADQYALTLEAPIPQNGQTHSNNSSAICQ